MQSVQTDYGIGMPRVAVLLATYNGIKWISNQVESILNQKGVEVRILVSDDLSTDGTWEWLQALSKRESRVQLLDRKEKFGRAAKNFYRLIEAVDVRDYDYIALADQDDIWRPEKLSRHASIMRSADCDGVSSDVEAFWEDQRHRLIVKSYAQTEFDYLFESPGPGCSFLLSSNLMELVKAVLAKDELGAREIHLHDWLIYAVCRSAGLGWQIDNWPSLLYRQHGMNEFGANAGWKAKIGRLQKISRGWYSGEVHKLLRMCMHISDREAFRAIEHLLVSRQRLSYRNKLLGIAWRGRRKLSDRLFLMSTIALGIF